MSLVTAQDVPKQSLACSTQSINQSSNYIMVVSFDRNTLRGVGLGKKCTIVPILQGKTPRRVTQPGERTLECAAPTPRLSLMLQMLEVVASHGSQLSALPRTCPSPSSSYVMTDWSLFAFIWGMKAKRLPNTTPATELPWDGLRPLS